MFGSVPLDRIGLQAHSHQDTLLLGGSPGANVFAAV
jgi:hypothetical protein